MFQQDQKIVRIGVIGLGKMGVLHTSLLNSMSNVKIAAVCDKSRFMRSLAKKTLNEALITDDINDLISLNLDGVYVTTPIPSHYAIVKQIFKNKIADNIFVEKTLTSNASFSQELEDLSEASQGINMVGYMKRFSVTFEKAKQLMVQNVIGNLLSFSAYAYSSDFIGIKNNPHRSNARGGVVHDLGAHTIDIALWMLGDLQVESAIIRSITGIGTTDDVDVKIRNNQLGGTILISWVKQGYRMPEFGISINGTKGTLDADDSRVKLSIKDNEQKVWYRQDLCDNVPFLLAEPEFYKENEYFIKSIINKTKPEPNFKTALKVDNLIAEVEGKADHL